MNTKNRYKPRPGIHEHLTVSVQGDFPPEFLFLNKPEYDENGLFVTKGNELCVDLKELFRLLGLQNTQVPMPVFLEICEHLLQKMEGKDDC